MYMDMMGRIRDLMDERDLNQNAVANIAGVSKGTVSQWFNGGYTPRAASLSKLADYFGVTVEYLLYGHETPRRVRTSPASAVPIRVVGAAHAGEPDEQWEFDGEAMLCEELAARHPRCFALQVNGDCMDRVFTDQDHVFVDPDMEPRDGSIAVIDVGGEAVVRRVKRGTDSLLLVAESHISHPDVLVRNGEARCIGVVFWWQARAESL